MKRRLNIGIGLLHRPKLLILAAWRLRRVLSV
jgi:hypothetical protein